MRLSAVPVLCAVNLGLSAALVWLWVQPDGTWRDVHWTAPAPMPPNLAGLLPSMGPPAEADVGQFLAILERPLFSPSRRPPPPPPPPPVATPAPPPPPPDPLANAVVAGLYGGADGGGVIVLVQGKPRIVRLNESIGDWQVESVDERSITLKRGAETRVVNITAVRELLPPSAAGSAPPPPSAAGMPGQGQAVPRATPRQRFTNN